MTQSQQTEPFHFSLAAVAPMGFKLLGIGITLVLFLSLVVYGVSVYFESRVVKMGRETRVLQEDNQDLQITLDRLRSYQKVADASSRIQGLQVATEVIDVAEKTTSALKLPDAPRNLPPKEAYGY